MDSASSMSTVDLVEQVRVVEVTLEPGQVRYAGGAGEVEQPATVDLQLTLRRLVEHGRLVRPQAALSTGGTRRHSGVERLLAEDRQIPPFVAHQAGVDILLDQARPGVAGELGTGPAAVVGVLDHHHRGIEPAHRHDIAVAAAGDPEIDSIQVRRKFWPGDDTGRHEQDDERCQGDHEGRAPTSGARPGTAIDLFSHVLSLPLSNHDPPRRFMIT